MKFNFFCLFVFTFLSSCATLSKQECMNGNWRDIGRHDGAKGYGADRFGKHIDACQRYDIHPDRQLYLSGRQEGLKSYCTPQSGLEAGKRGEVYENVCPPEAEAAFLKSFRLGKEMYELDKQIREIDKKIQDTEQKLNDKKIQDADRWQLREEIRRLEEERRSLRRARSALETAA